MTQIHLLSIQQAEEQREQHTDQNGSAERKVKREVVALVTEVQGKATDPERQPRSKHEHNTDKRQNNAHHYEQSAHLLHDNIVLLGLGSPFFGGESATKKLGSS